MRSIETHFLSYKPELDINNIRIIDKGWKLAFGQEKGMNKFAISFYLDIKNGIVNL